MGPAASRLRRWALLHARGDLSDSRPLGAGKGKGAVRYFTSFGPQSGALLYSTALGAIAVLESSDDPTPIGVAMCVGPNVRGHATWMLNVHGDDVSGRWIVIDREFHP